jgi:hypothetical protein
MVWGAFSYGGKFELKIVRGNMNAEKYQQLLEAANIEDNGSLFAGEDFIFQQDNAPPHSVSFFRFTILLVIFASILF